MDERTLLSLHDELFACHIAPYLAEGEVRALAHTCSRLLRVLRRERPLLIEDTDLFDAIKRLDDQHGGHGAKYWEFPAGSPESAGYGVISRLLLAEQKDDIRAKYASDGISGGMAGAWLAAIGAGDFADRALSRMSRDGVPCDKACVAHVINVLREEFPGIAMLHASLKSAEHALNAHSATVQANIDLAKLSVKAEDKSNVKAPEGGMAKFMLGLLGGALGSLPGPFGPALKFTMSLMKGANKALAKAGTSSYDADAPLEAAVADLKSTMQSRHLFLSAEYGRQFNLLAKSPLHIRMFRAVATNIGTPTDEEIDRNMHKSTATVRQSLVRLLIPSKWQVCYSENCYHKREYEYNCPCRGEKFSVARPYNVKGLVPAPCGTMKCGGDVYAWMCPNGRFDGGTLTDLKMYEDAGFEATWNAEWSILARVVKKQDDQLREMGFGEFKVQGPCPLDRQ